MTSSFGWLVQPAVFPWVALVLGLCVGSFLNVVIHRLPRMTEREWLEQIPEILEEADGLKDRPGTGPVADEVRRIARHIVDDKSGLVTPRSRCPSCGGAIKAWQNVPVLSWIFLRGKCANCKTAISLKYPIVELLAGIGAAGSAWHFGFGAPAFGAMLFVWCTIALAFIDQATGYLHDDITLPLLWVGLLFNLYETFVPLRDAVAGAAAGYLILWSVNAVFKLLRGIDGMGYGDFKMTAAVGAFVGWKYLFMVIFLSSCVGLFFGLLQMIGQRQGWNSLFKFHFGPYIALAGIVTLFYGPAIQTAIPLLRPFG